MPKKQLYTFRIEITIHKETKIKNKIKYIKKIDQSLIGRANNKKEALRMSKEYIESIKN